MVDKAEKPARMHRATYARDKKKGGYLVRVAGPNAARFAGRDVPVTITGGEEHTEKLVKMIWSGIENTTEYGGKIGEPIALYTFESRPKDPEPEADF